MPSKKMNSTFANESKNYAMDESGKLIEYPLPSRDYADPRPTTPFGPQKSIIDKLSYFLGFN